MTNNDNTAGENSVSRRSVLKTMGAIGIGSVSGLVVGTNESIDRAKATTQSIYTGSATTVARPVDYFGNPGRPQTFKTDSEVIITPPYTYGGVTESNPFHLSIQTGEAGTDGSVSLSSAHKLLTPETGRPLLLQYWSYDYNSNSGALSGELTNTHSTEGAALNILWMEQEITSGTSYSGYSQFINEGAIFSGQATNNNIRLVIQGTVHNRVPFTSRLEASR